ncbi:glycosyltransferase family 4 protein [Pseudomonas sp. CW003PS]|nr:glycosyltransferase family 4 protein [Pseudomonas sp. CW003PS]
MKVLIVNTSDIEGGAARAAYRLHRSLLEAGVDSNMLVQSNASDDFTVIGPADKLQKGLSKLRPTLDAIPVRRYKNRTKTLFSPAWLPFSGIVDRINEFDPDVVHLHWVTGGMLRIEDVARIRAPVLWSLHDMWAFTGGCHYDEECGKFKNSCGSCPVLASVKESDLSSKVLQRKQVSFKQHTNLTIVGLSNWLANQAKRSTLFKNTSVVNLPNPIDTKSFSPFSKQQSRTLFNLPGDKKLVLFGAMGATSDPRKGFKELAQALDHLPSEYELVVFGSSEPKISQGFKQKAHYLGHLHDDITLRVLYNAADVMVVPSLQENLSNAIMESLSCGTPVVGFDIGGNSDLIDHQVNGYLTEPYSTDDLAKGIDWVLQHQSPDKLADNARQKVLENFESSLVASKYINLYREVLGKEK